MARCKTALRFSPGTTVELDLGEPLGTAPITMAAWVRLDPDAKTSTIVEHFLCLEPNTSLGLRNVVQFGSKPFLWHPFVPYEWVHVAAVWPEGETQIELFVNGESVGKSAAPEARSQRTISVGKNLCGEIAEVRVWRRALDSEALSSDAIASPDTSEQLVGAWDFGYGGTETNVGEVRSRLTNVQKGVITAAAGARATVGPGDSLIGMALPQTLEKLRRRAAVSSDSAVELSALLGYRRKGWELFRNLQGKTRPLLIENAQCNTTESQATLTGEAVTGAFGRARTETTFRESDGTLQAKLTMHIVEPAKGRFAVGGLRSVMFQPAKLEYHACAGSRVEDEAESLTIDGSFIVRGEGHSEFELPVQAKVETLGRDWTFSLLGAGAQPTFTQMVALGGDADLVAGLDVVLGWLPKDAPIDLKRLDLGVDLRQGTMRAIGVTFGSRADKQWTIVEGFTLRNIEVTLDVREPGDAWRRRSIATLIGGVTLGSADIDFKISNAPGHWRLSPVKEVIPLDRAGDFLVALMAPNANDTEKNALRSTIPEWLGSKTELVGLALDFDPSSASISALSGGLQWQGLKCPGLDGATINKIRLDLSISQPFSSNRQTRFRFLGKATFPEASTGKSHELTLAGGHSDAGWELSAALRGTVSLSDLLSSIAAKMGAGEAADLLAKLQLSLVNPEFKMGPSSGDFAVHCGISLGGGKAIPLGDASFQFKYGLIEIRRSSGNLSWRVSAGCDFTFASGLEFSRTSVTIGDVGIRVGTSILLPGETKDERVGFFIDGGYSSGKGLTLSGRQNKHKIALKPAIEKMAGAPLEAFPELFASDLALTFDTGSAHYSASGTAMASSIRIDDVEIRDATLQFALDSRIADSESKKRSTSVKFYGSAKILRSRKKTENLTDQDFITIQLRIDFDGESADYLATVGNLSLADFASAFGVDVGASETTTLEGLGFRYRSQPPAKKGDKDPVTPSTTLSFFTENGSLGRVDIAFAKKNDADKFHPLVLVTPKLSWVEKADIGYGGAAFSAVPLGTTKIPTLEEGGTLGTKASFTEGLFFHGTFVLKGSVFDRRLGISDAIRLGVEDAITFALPNRPDVKPLEIFLQNKEIVVKNKALFDAPPSTPGKPSTTELVKPKEGSKEDSTDEIKKPLGDDGEKTFRFDKKLSLASIVQWIAPAREGSSTSGTWREVVGNFIVVTNIGVKLSAKPQPNVVVFADVSLNVGQWLSVTAAELSVSVRRSAVTFDLQGGAIALQLPPWIKGGAAVLKKETRERLDIYGMGELQLMQKVRIAALAYLSFGKTLDETTSKQRYDLNAGFGFVCATGLNLAIPPVVITGVAGGFGYRVIPKLPDKPEAVVENALLKLLTNKTTEPSKPNSAQAMIEQLREFEKSIERRNDAWCALVGLTFSVAQVVHGAVLVVLESRVTGIEVALLGHAAFTLGAKTDHSASNAGPQSGVLGHLELGLLAKFSAQSGTVSILGAITGKSWLFHEDCKLRGSFALCYWGKGDHAGDFLVSVGGYSPLRPKPAHYPALERVGFRWNVDSSLTIGGDAYLCLDRHSLAVGCAADVRLEKPKVRINARFSFDALVQWAPLYYEAQLRIHVHVELRVITTLRLGLDVEMHLWGPPFGAKLHVEVDIWPVKPSFDIMIGPSIEEVKRRRDGVTIHDIAALAAGGQAQPTMRYLCNREPATLNAPIQPDKAGRIEYNSVSPSSGDDFTISMETAIPVTDVTIDGRSSKTILTGLQVRAKNWRDIRSELGIRMQHSAAGPNGPWKPVPGKWEVETESRPVLESLWCIPENTQTPWTAKGSELISTVQIRPPTANGGKFYENVRLTCWETTVANVNEERDGYALPQQAPSRKEAAQALQGGSQTRTSIVEALKKGGFGLGGARADDFRAFDDVPLMSRAGGVS